MTAQISRTIEYSSVTGLVDPDGLKAAVTELETGHYREDPWSKLVEVITLDQVARAFLPLTLCAPMVTLCLLACPGTPRQKSASAAWPRQPSSRLGQATRRPA